MSNVVELVALFAAHMGDEYQAMAAEIATADQERGDLSTLSTEAKDSLVNALNEVKGVVDGIDSISETEVNTLITTAVDGLIDGAPGTYDTLKEIADYLAADQTATDAIMLSLAKRVRVDAPQNFTEAEEAQGRENLKAAAAADVGDVATADFVQTYNTAKST